MCSLKIGDRFWSKVEKTETCWNWTASKSHDGYGRIGVGKTVLYSHRVSYEMANGPIPEGLVLDHTCHVRACVRPSHLRAVTHQQNLENRQGATRGNLTSGVRGVSFNRHKQKWEVSAMSAGKSHYGGQFTSLKDAELAAIELRLRVQTHNAVDRRGAAK